MSTGVTTRLPARPGAPLIVAAPLAAAVGFSVAAGFWTYVLAMILLAAGLLAGLRDWRFSIYALLVFLPYSGLLIIGAYPSTGPAVLAKDLFFVIPAYLGYGIACLLQRKTAAVPGFPVIVAIALATLVLLQLLNPTLPSLLVGLIGAKVWLMYIPMAFLGYHLIRGRDDLERMLRLIALAAVVPCLIGIIEGVLIAAGHSGAVYSLYGDAAAAVTQDFANVGGTSGDIHRVSSTFSFVGQYYSFTTVMLVAAYAYWRGFLSRQGGLKPWLGAALFVLVAFAAVLSGARGALFSVPALTITMLLLDGHELRRYWWLPFASVAAVAGAANVFGTTTGRLVSDVAEHSVVEFTIGTVDGFHEGFHRTVLGLGPGVDTQSARYALPQIDPFSVVGGHVFESWWVKSLLELGIVGLAITVALLLGILHRLVSLHRGLRDPSLRAVSSAFLALVVFVIAYNFKGSYLDLDPMNVLFWLFVGVALKLPRLEREERLSALKPDGQVEPPQNVPVPLRT
jgi:hypothetical protein